MSKELQFNDGEIEMELCRKCGADADVYATDLTLKNQYLYWAECDDCNNRTALYLTIKQAIKHWNKQQEEPDE